MTNNEKSSLKEKILEEMIVDHQNLLEKYFNLAKRFISITSQGSINIMSEEKYPIEEKILLYLIGKIYAKEAGLTLTEEVGVKELMDNLGILKGTIYPVIKRLRDKKKIIQRREGKLTYITIQLNILGNILSKMKDSSLNE